MDKERQERLMLAQMLARKLAELPEDERPAAVDLMLDDINDEIQAFDWVQSYMNRHGGLFSVRVVP